ncbi:CoA-transferase family III [Stipitochalara longipes BDJ]|nr:CoA-transferase family III [Stipitochalara longipes BDJ]
MQKLSGEGSQLPSVPVDWRLAESVSALKALEGATVGALLRLKDNARPRQMVINTNGPPAGLKVVDLTRVIAAPAITRRFAEMGASVMRVTGLRIAEFSAVHCDVNWGKCNCFLDFRKEGDRTQLRQLILDSDVVVQGYRPHVLDKWGFDVDDIFEFCRSRGIGIICVRENCYDWYGPWADRSGWRQMSDVFCGISMDLGRAMGNNEPVIPFFPNSNYSTDVSGVVGVLLALLRRPDQGDSYIVFCTLLCSTIVSINLTTRYLPSLASWVYVETIRYPNNLSTIQEQVSRI